MNEQWGHGGIKVVVGMHDNAATRRCRGQAAVAVAVAAAVAAVASQPLLLDFLKNAV